MKDDEIRKTVRERYAGKVKEQSSCCGPSTSCCGGGARIADEVSKVIGNRFLIVPGLPPEYCDSLDAWARTADVFNEIAERLKPHGMQTGYHNHFHEFDASGGRSAWDVLIGGTSADVVMQLDVGNAMKGGGDCAAILRQYPGRAVTLHVKEFRGASEAVVGEGEVDWKEILPLAAEVGGTQWYIIEHERDEQRAMSDVDRCLVNIRAIVAGL